jgi:hypothetical protein
MKTKIFQISVLAALCMGMAACSSDDDATTSQSDHQPIQLSSNLSASVQTRAAFSSSTSMKLFLSGTNADDGTKAAITSSVGATAAVEESGFSAVTFNPQPYWDDFYGRSAKLAVYGIALANSSTALTFTDLSSIPMTLPTDQTAGTSSVDYVYSNNLSGEGCMKYDNGFPTGNLEFKHLMSKITVNVVGTTGFDISTDGAKLLLKNFPTTGTFNLNGCTWSNYGTAADVTASTKATAAEGYKLSYEALVLPGSRNPNDATDKAKEALSLTVNSSTYSVALQDIMPTGITSLESNKNYTVDITLSKTSISMTASVEDWVDVASIDKTPLTVASTSGTTTSGTESGLSFDLYLCQKGAMPNYGTEKQTAVTYNSGTSKYSYSPTPYWPSLTDAYSLRGVTPGTAVSYDATNGSYVAVATTDASNNAQGGDLIMGTPCSAYTSYATKTINDDVTATTAAVGLIFNHMKPKVNIQLTSESGGKALDLSNATVTINNVYTAGNFLLKDLTYATTGATGTCNVATDGTASTTSHNFTFYAFPQTLSDGVTMTITASGYTFTATLKTAAVDSWIPGKAYTYKLTISKTSISSVVATGENWDTWSIKNQNVYL